VLKIPAALLTGAAIEQFADPSLLEQRQGFSMRVEVLVNALLEFRHLFPSPELSPEIPTRCRNGRKGEMGV
jgi:hypothetical protein